MLHCAHEGTRKTPATVKTTASIIIAMVILVVPFASATQRQVTSDETVASVNGAAISRTEFETAVYRIGRSTMYHGQPTGDEQYLEFRHEVMDKLIERHLLLQEGGRRGIRPDASAIDSQLAVYEQRYSETERWQREGAQMLQALRERFEEDSVLASLESMVRDVPNPEESVLQAYYQENPQKFTEPKQDKVSIILLSVQPSAGAAVWSAARQEGRGIVEDIRSGADFADMARLRSADTTAPAGGDMGYIHSGMLSAAAQAAIDDLSIGDISEPVTVLEGIAIFYLQDRKSPKLRSFEDVRLRAQGLWLREQADQQWNALVSALRDRADIDIDTEYVATFPVASQ